MALDNTYSLDGVDLQILTILAADGRISVSALSKAINMSAPSVAERLRRLEARGIIRNYTVDVDLSVLGYSLEAIVRLKPRSGKLKLVEKMIDSEQRFVSCDRVTGDDCYIAKLVLRSVDELDDLLEPFHDCAETNTSIVKSSLIRTRQPFSK